MYGSNVKGIIMKSDILVLISNMEECGWCFRGKKVTYGLVMEKDNSTWLMHKLIDDLLHNRAEFKVESQVGCDAKWIISVECRCGIVLEFVSNACTFEGELDVAVLQRRNDDE